MDDAAPWSLIAATVVLDLGLAALIGSAASSLWLLRDARSAWSEARARRSHVGLLASACVTAVALVGLLWVQAATMADVPLREVAGALAPVLGTTQIGHAWLAAAASLAVVLIAARTGRPASTVVAALGIVAFACCRAAASHAAAHGVMTWAVAIEATHLLLTSLWIGLVGLAATALDPASIGPDAGARADASAWVHRLSTTATAALAGIVLTGLFNAGRGLGAPADLVDTGWGRLLVVKLVLVGAAVGLGGLNRVVVMPDLLAALARGDNSTAPSMNRFRRVARVESALLAAALVAAVMLGATAPAV